jgi:hypothetical protein
MVKPFIFSCVAVGRFILRVGDQAKVHYAMFQPQQEAFQQPPRVQLPQENLP